MAKSRSVPHTRSVTDHKIGTNRARTSAEHFRREFTGIPFQGHIFTAFPLQTSPLHVVVLTELFLDIVGAVVTWPSMILTMHIPWLNN